MSNGAYWCASIGEPTHPEWTLRNGPEDFLRLREFSGLDLRTFSESDELDGDGPD